VASYRNELRSRYDDEYLVEHRQQRGETFNAWKQRIEEADALIRGEFPVKQADGSTLTEQPIVSNLADQMPRDVARLANEVAPTFRAPAMGDSDPAIQNAQLRGVITEGYFEKNRFDILRPQLTMDLVIAGAAFMVCWTDDRAKYPQMQRVDPRGAFPTLYNGTALDLLVVQKMPVRLADRLYREANIMRDWSKMKDPAGYVEMWEYYCDDECLRAVALVGADASTTPSGVTILKRWYPKTDCPPIAFAQLPSPDNSFHGLIDQVGSSLVAKNQMARYVIEISDQMAYAPFEARGVINAGDPPGPNTIYQHDPSATEDTFIRRVEPAKFNNQLFGLLQFLDDEQRGQLAYPAARQGDVSQSIASASFVAATQGQLTSVVRDIQRLLADMQEQAGMVCQQLDENYLDFEKPLAHAIGRKKTYRPSKDIGGVYGVQVNYGAGAGMDRLNTDVRLLQFYGAGAISLETLLENVDFVTDATGEIDKRQREEVLRIILQRWAGDPQTLVDFMLKVVELQADDGLTFTEALKAAKEQVQAQAPPTGAAGAAGMPTGPQDANAPTQAGLEAGANTSQPSEPVVEPSFSSTPLEQIFVSPRQ